MDTVKMSPLGYQQITDFSSPVGLTPPTGAQIAILNAETADLRWRDDAATTAPSSTIGMLLSTTQPPYQYNGNLEQIRFAAVSGSPVLNISYYKPAG